MPPQEERTPEGGTWSAVQGREEIPRSLPRDTAAASRMLSISQRRLEPELMDDPGLASPDHISALRALERVNLLSLTAQRIWREVSAMGREESGPLRILDVACGGGDVLLTLKERAESAGMSLEVHGCDSSETALRHARDQARRRGLAARFHSLDVTRQELPEGFDLVVSNLFLHHLSTDEAVVFLGSLARAGRAILVQDLVRSLPGYWLAWGTLRLISRSRVAHVDGPRSVQAAFRVPEVVEMTRDAGLEGALVKRCWPQRFLLKWRRSP